MNCIIFPYSAWLDRLMLFVSIFGNYTFIPILLVAITAVLLYQKKFKNYAYAVVVSTVVSEIIKQWLKVIIKAPRPGWSGCLTMVELKDYSFPSGHAVFYTVFFGMVAYITLKEMKKTRFGALITGSSLFLIFMVGFSRVYLGAHWPSDVLAGYAIGGIILAATIIILNHYEKK